MAEALPFAVLISGRGSNMVALATAAAEGRIAGRVAVVVSDQPAAEGLGKAATLGLPTAVIEREGHSDAASYGRALGNELARHGVRLVALAGFMRILDPSFCRRWQGRLLNIHPSLLPAYPGLRTHRRVLAAGDSVHGCTVHFVTPELDAGPAIVQARVPVLPGDDEAALSARVQRMEHIIYPRAVAWFAEGRLSQRGAAAWLDGRQLKAPVIEDRA